MTTNDSMGTRKLSLETIASESEAEYARLLKRLQDGDLLYAPNPGSLYAWELKIDERHETWGHTNYHSYTEIYLTKELATKAACAIIRERHVSGTESWRGNQTLKELLDSGKHEEAIKWVAQHYSSPQFEIRAIEIRCSPERNKI